MSYYDPRITEAENNPVLVDDGLHTLKLNAQRWSVQVHPSELDLVVTTVKPVQYLGDGKYLSAYHTSEDCGDVHGEEFTAEKLVDWWPVASEKEFAMAQDDCDHLIVEREERLRVKIEVGTARYMVMPGYSVVDSVTVIAPIAERRWLVEHVKGGQPHIKSMTTEDVQIDFDYSDFDAAQKECNRLSAERHGLPF